MSVTKVALLHAYNASLHKLFWDVAS